MNNKNNDLSTRIEVLSSQQRLLLANRISLHSQSSDAHSKLSGNSGQQHLIAYVCGPTANEETKQSLRAWLETRVPNYMVPQSIVIVDGIPRSEAGKIDHSVLRVLKEENEFTRDSHFEAPRNDAEKILTSIWEEVLEMDSVSIHDNFFEVGGDSLLSIRILARARQQGLKISPEHFFSHPSVAGQAAAAGQVSKVKAESGLIKGSAPLLAIQHWFFERINVEPEYWNQSILLSLTDDIELVTLERAIQQILIHHDALRLKFQYQDKTWKQTFTELSVELPLETLDLSLLAKDTWATEIDKLATRLNSEFTLNQGFLLRFALIRTASNYPDKLLIVIHHLIVDGESWRILLEDLSQLCQQIGNEETIKLPQKSSSFKTWVSRMQSYAESETIAAEADWWTGISQNSNFELAVDFDAKPEANCAGSTACVSVSLDVDQTRHLLRDIPQLYRTQINDVLLTALCQALNRWTGSTSILFDVEGHGRESLFDDIDLSRTIGWFTTVFPVLLSFNNELDPGKSLQQIKQQLRDIPANGIGHGLLHYMSAKLQLRKALNNAPRAEVCFNYLGKVEQQFGSFKIEQTYCGVARSPRGPRAYLIDINAQIINECLSIDWRYSEAIHKRQSIVNLSRWYIESLTELISFSQLTESGGYTSSDFPLANLGQEELDGLSQLLDQLDD